MRLTTLLLTLTILQVSARTLAQKVSLSAKNTPLSSVIEQLRSQTGYDFMITTTLLKESRPVTIKADQQDLKEVLENIFKDQPLNFDITDKAVVISRKDPSFFDRLKAVFAAIDVHGTVVDENGRPLPGVTVKLKDNSQVTTTDLKGEFFLQKANEKSVIVMSFIGYQSKEVPAAAEMGSVQLQIATSKLDEVQVKAYGQTSERFNTGNITTVSSKDIEKNPVQNPVLALQGRVAGISIIQATGNANSGIKVVIQGQNSIFNGNDPFYVIDGVPYSAAPADPYTMPYANSGGSPLSFIDPGNIESISVLKDADATAIYGSRAANGAILITTKKGKPGAMKTDFNLRQGFGQVGRRLSMMNTQQYLAMRHEALKNDGSTIKPTDYDINGTWDTTRYTDWQKQLIGRNAVYSNYAFNLSGGSDNTTYLFGTTYNRSTTVFPDSRSDRSTAVHFTLNSKSKDQRFTVQLKTQYIHDINELPTSDIPSLAFSLQPDAPEPFNADGTLNWALNSSGAATWKNPYAPLLNSYIGTTDNLVSDALLNYDFGKGFQFKSSFGYNQIKASAVNTYPTEAWAPNQQQYFPSFATFFNSTQSTWIIEPQLTYSHTFSFGQLNFLGGGTIQQRRTVIQDVEGDGYLSSANLTDQSSAGTLISAGSSDLPYKYTGLFGELNYNYQQKYLANLSIRRDGSSRFGEKNRYHNFEAVGLGWVFTEEGFLKNKLGPLNFGKFKFSYGTTGSDQILDYRYLSLYYPNTPPVLYGGYSGLEAVNLANPYLQWEETHKLNWGLSLGLWHDKVVLEVDRFRNRSSNQLTTSSLPTFVGFEGIARNFPATVQNSGWEFTLNTRVLDHADLKWSANVNLTLPQNKLIRYDNLAGSQDAGRLFIGKPITLINLFKYAGVNPQTGIYQFYDSNGNLTSTPNYQTDQIVKLDLSPKFYGGIENNFSYKSFQLSFLFNFVKQMGANMSTSPSGFIPGSGKSNALTDVLNRWQTPGQAATYEKFSANSSLYGPLSAYRGSTAGYADASYIKLKNATLGWNLPKAWQERLHMQNARVFAQGQNLLTFTHYKGLDPESLTTNTLPPLRVITFGVQTTF